MKKTSLFALFLCSFFMQAQCWLQVDSSSSEFGNFNLGIQHDGTLWAWGVNTNGQLGDGTTINRTIPTQIGTDTDWAFVAAGRNSSYALKQDGSLWAWGDNSKGQLSDDSTVGRLSPAQVLPGTTWIKVSAGDEFVVAQKTDGTLWACGNSSGGETGLGSATDVSTFTQNTTITDWESLKTSYRHTLLRRSDGTIWGFWGGVSGGILATGSDAGLSTPTQLPQLPNGEWLQAIPGNAQSLFKKNDGTIWGVGAQGSVLGLGSTANILTLTQIGNDNDWLSVENSSLHTMALKNDGSLWATGRNQYGQIGIGTTNLVTFFTQVGTINCGAYHTLAIDNQGTLWAWGRNNFGQLGNGTTTNRTTPIQIGIPCNLSVPTHEQKVMHLLQNPVGELAQLSFVYDGVKKLTVYNTTGQLVFKTTVTEDFVSINTSSFAKGVYLIQCESEMGNEVLKMVKQ
jgi:alpha-tubulin suppressor-like RCC1 family protein